MSIKELLSAGILRHCRWEASQTFPSGETRCLKMSLLLGEQLTASTWSRWCMHCIHSVLSLVMVGSNYFWSAHFPSRPEISVSDFPYPWARLHNDIIHFRLQRGMGAFACLTVVGNPSPLPSLWPCRRGDTRLTWLLFLSFPPYHQASPWEPHTAF